MLNFIKNKISYVIIFAISLALSLVYFLLMLDKDIINSFVLCLCLIAIGGVCRLFAKKFGVASVTATVTAVVVYWVYAAINSGGYVFLALLNLLFPTIFIVAVMTLFAFGDMTVSIFLYLLKSKRKKQEEAGDNRGYSKAALITYPIFAFCAFAFGMVLFIIKAEEITMPSPPGSWFGPAITLLFIMLAALGLFFVAAIIISALMDKKAKISFLLIIAISMPIFQFCTANSLFFYGQPLHFTIEEGGIFYPIYESKNTNSHFENKHDRYDIWKHCHFVHSEVIAYGRGSLFNCIIGHLDATAQPSHYMIEVDAGFGSKVEYFEVYLTPRSDIKPEQISIWIEEEDTDLRFTSFKGARVELSREDLPDGRIKLILLPIVDPNVERGDTRVVLNYDIE
ncbi:MAG: hypothetical protein E7642_07040 [Ruminococcaceae bacterium]|nr:hypothetical protein [Oscillospiraceae bacterium]